MLCNVLYMLYGRDTRAAQWLNIIVAMTWLTVFAIQTGEVARVGLPTALLFDPVSPSVLCAMTLLVAAFGLALRGRPKQVFKTFGLILGAMSQAVIANGYVTAYPPLDMMIVVSTALSLWFFGAVLYITRCEGLNGTTGRKT